jgi:hypothetical protein
MMTPKVLEWLTINDRPNRRTQQLLKNVMGVWAGHGIHCVKLHAKSALEKCTKSVKAK